MNSSELQNTIHQEQLQWPFSSSLKELVSTAVCSISVVKFYAESLRSEINKYIYQPLEETSP